MQFNKKIYIERLFPDVIEKNLFFKLKIDHESIMYITIPADADMINQLIINHVIKKGLDITDMIITDATAGVGGDTISFAKIFKEVISIELDKERYNYLSNNVSAYKFDNVILFNDDALKIIQHIEKQDIIFIDPPWGGKDYKKNNNLRLYINDIELEDCCISFLDKTKMKCVPSLIVLKLPINYDLQYLTEKLEKYCDINVYNLQKMMVVIIQER